MKIHETVQDPRGERSSTRTAALLRELHSAETDLRGQLDRISGCLDSLERIHRSNAEGFLGMLGTLQAGLDVIDRADTPVPAPVRTS